MQFLIRDDEPFRGHCQSVLNKDGTVAYTDGLTVAEYEAERGFKVKVIEEPAFDALMQAHYESLKTKPIIITKEAFWYALEVLPPCRWHHVGG